MGVLYPKDLWIRWGSCLGGGWSLRVRFRDIYRSVSGMNADPEEFVNAAGELVAPMEVLEQAIDDLSSGIFRKVLEDAKKW